MVALRVATEVAMEPRVAVATRAPKVAATVALKLEDTAVPRGEEDMEEHRVVEALLGDMVELRVVDMEVDIRTTTSVDQRKRDEVRVKELPGEVLEVDTDRTRRPISAADSRTQLFRVVV